MDIKNKNELKRRIDLFLHDFTPEEYKINEEFCKETMRMTVMQWLPCVLKKNFLMEHMRIWKKSKRERLNYLKSIRGN